MGVLAAGEGGSGVEGAAAGRGSRGRMAGSRWRAAAVGDLGFFFQKDNRSGLSL